MTLPAGRVAESEQSGIHFINENQALQPAGGGRQILKRGGRFSATCDMNQMAINSTAKAFARLFANRFHGLKGQSVLLGCGQDSASKRMLRVALQTRRRAQDLFPNKACRTDYFRHRWSPIS